MQLSSFPTALLHALTLAHPSGRFTYGGLHRTHIELRRMSPEDATKFDRRIRERLEALPAVTWVRRNAALDRLIVAHEDADTSAVEALDLLTIVEQVEEEVGVSKQPFASNRLQQPGSDARAGEVGMLVAANLLTLGVSRLSVRSGARPDISVAATLIHAIPSIRESLERRFGSAAAEMGIAMLGSTARFVNRSSLSAASYLLVDGVKLGEASAGLEAWQRWEPRLFSNADEQDSATPGSARKRVTELPWGPVERYVDRATLMATGSFVVRLAMNKPLQSAAMFLYAGLPLPARIGRDTFLNAFSQRLSRDGGLILRHEKLALLDRVDLVVLDARLLPPSAEVVESMELHQGSANEEELRVAASRKLLGLEDGPQRGLTLRKTFEGRKGNGYELLRDGRRIGSFKSRAVESSELETLRRAAANANVELAVVGKAVDLQGIGKDVAVEVAGDAGPPKSIEAYIRRRQRDGKVVMYVGGGPQAAFDECDVGFWTWRADWAPAWNADAVIEARPAIYATLIHATGAAHGVSRRAVHIAQAEAVIGTSIGMTFPAGKGLARVFSSRHYAAVGAFADAMFAVRNLPDVPDVDPSRRHAWHAMDAEHVLESLDSRSEGLSTVDARSRAEQRKQTEKKSPAAKWLSAFADELRNPMTPVLLGGAGLSAATSSTTEAALVASVLGFDAAWSATQRMRAERNLDALSDWDEVNVQVLRDGRITVLPPSDLVEGDVLLLGAGDVIPADLRVLEAEGLEVDESALTGESVPVKKQVTPVYKSVINEQRSLLFEGTSVSAGTTRAVVIEAGEHTHAGRLAHESAQVRESRQSQRHSASRIESLSRLTLPAAGIASAMVFGSGLLRRTKPHVLLRSVVSLSVAAIPEGLTLLPTMGGLAASSRLAERQVRVRDHLAPERFADVDILCIDKTGTLTDANLRVAEISDLEHWAALSKSTEAEPWIRELLQDGALASLESAEEGRESSTDKVDVAVLEAARKQIDFKANKLAGPVEVMAFDARRGFQAARLGTRVVVKGAPERLFERAELDDAQREAWTQAVDRLSRKGLHVLAVARGQATVNGSAKIDDAALTNLEIVGLLGMTATTRAGARQAVLDLEKLGVKVVMLTGDHPTTARVIAAEVGLDPEGMLDGPELEQLDPTQLVEKIRGGAHLARVTPRHKARIIETLQRAGHSVAMVGDGANDAAALRLADVGIVVDAQATPAAIDASDAVIGGDLTAVTEMLIEGRRVKKAMGDAMGVLVGGNLGEIGFVGLAGLLSGRSPLNARQLMMVNMLTDAVPALVIAARDPERRLRFDPDGEIDPPTHAERVFAEMQSDESMSVEAQVAWRGIITSAAALSAWGTARWVMPRKRAETVGLLALVGAQLAQTAQSAEGDRRVHLASAIGLGVLLGAVQIPGVSRLTGSRPVGPVGLTIAATASVGAAVGASMVKRLPHETREAPAQALERAETWAIDAKDRIGRKLEKLRRKGLERSRGLLHQAEKMGSRMGFDLETTGADVIGDADADDLGPLESLSRWAGFGGGTDEGAVA